MTDENESLKWYESIQKSQSRSPVEKIQTKIKRTKNPWYTQCAKSPGYMR